MLNYYGVGCVHHVTFKEFPFEPDEMYYNTKSKSWDLVEHLWAIIHNKLLNASHTQLISNILKLSAEKKKHILIHLC